MPVREVSKKELKERTDEILEDARYEPIAITEKGERQFVVMSAELFLTVYAGSRRVGSTAELTDEELGETKSAKLPKGFRHLDESVGDDE